MAVFSLRRLYPYFTLLFSSVLSAVVRYDFNVTWVWCNPDGAFPRPMIGINGRWPLPEIRAEVGDTVVVKVMNLLGNQSTSLHFHGLYMDRSTSMDGTASVSQCEIQHGQEFQYRFNVRQPGTYWYHSHTKAQYPDGLRGMLIVHDDNHPFRSQYDQELVLSLSDHYHAPMSELMAQYDVDSMDPAPDSNLISDRSDLRLLIEPGTSYLVRLANIGAFTSQWFWIQDHTMKVVEVDGVYTEPCETDLLYLGAGQRYSFILEAKNGPAATQNYAFFSRVDKSSYSMGNDPDIVANGWLVYPGNTKSTAMSAAPMSRTQFDIFDDASLVPYDRQPLFEPVSQRIVLRIDMVAGDAGIFHWAFNATPYDAPERPSLFAAITAGLNAANPSTYASNTQPLVLKHNRVVEIEIHNAMMDHPIHLHGHNFQVLRTLDMDGKGGSSAAPMRRDTVIAKEGDTTKIRFIADNPGVWLLHCHMEWHAHSGLVATVVEAPLALQRQETRLAHLLSGAAEPNKSCPNINRPLLLGGDDPEPHDSWSPHFSTSALYTIIAIVVLAILSVTFWFKWNHCMRSWFRYSLLANEEDGGCEPQQSSVRQ